MPPLDLLPTGDNVFFAEGFPYQFEFIKDEPGKVVQINVVGNGEIVCRIKRKN
jgi:hypothetical protein